MANAKENSSATSSSEPRLTVMTELQRLEDTLKDSMHRVEVIEKKLTTKLLTMESRERLEHELELVKEVLQKNEKRLQSLRKENTKTFMIAAAVVFAIFLIYGLYCTITNTS
ncbi:hypothetical protein PV326_001515 [Microctonus aethiopoides]|nr:hypothetical protein PV326_001515 [Microctonus aethiopoides]